MKRSKFLSTQVTDMVSKKLPGKSKDELEIINYGVETFLMNIYKMALIFAAAYLLNITDLLIVMICCNSLVRFFASGVHAKGWLVCLISTFIIQVGVIYLSMMGEMHLSLKLTLYAFSLIVLWKNAPADTEDKPIINKERRARLRMGALGTTTILFIYSFITKDYVIGNICIMSFTASSIFTMPMVYKIYGRKFENYKAFLSTDSVQI